MMEVKIFFTDYIPQLATKFFLYSTIREFFGIIGLCHYGNLRLLYSPMYTYDNNN